MELKVWVDGIQRIVCGVTESTTCQDVVYALAHATGKTGRFTLSERWRSNERLLSPQDHPLQVLLKWGEYSPDVQFILQRSVLDENKGLPAANSSLNHKIDSPESGGVLHGLIDNSMRSADKYKDLKKSLTFTGHTTNPENYSSNKIGVVRGIPKKRDDLEVREHKDKPTVQKPENSQSQSPARREVPPYRDPPGPPSGTCSPHQRTLPPYRNPPPPTSNPMKATVSGPSSPLSNNTMVTQGNCQVLKPKRNLVKEFQIDSTVGTGTENNFQQAVLCNTQYRDLIRLVNFQREKLSVQHSDLTKFDAEIIYWESKAKEQQHQLEFISLEKNKMESLYRQNEDQLRSLNHSEGEFELVRQQEKTLKSEISLLRSKLANCETELLQCKNKIRLLIEELHTEKMAALRDSDERQHLERALVNEVERLQHEIDLARQSADMNAQTGDNLQKEVSQLEAAISERKRQLEQLLNEMKEANLESLVIAPPEELKHLIEGPYKPGITRKMVGSPRQLENAVPTSKNPHGVWV